MTRLIRIVFALAAMALAVCAIASGRGPSEEDDEAQRLQETQAACKDVLRLADCLDRDEDEIEKQAHAIATNHDLRSVMGVFRPRAGAGDGLKLIALGKKPLTPKQLEDRRDDLIRLAKATLAASRVVPLYASRYIAPAGPLTKRDWAMFSDAMKDASQDLMDALKGDDVTAVCKTAGRLNASCNGCHGAGRDK